MLFHLKFTYILCFFVKINRFEMQKKILLAYIWNHPVIIGLCIPDPLRCPKLSKGRVFTKGTAQFLLLVYSCVGCAVGLLHSHQQKQFNTKSEVKMALKLLLKSLVGLRIILSQIRTLPFLQSELQCTKAKQLDTIKEYFSCVAAF